MKYFAALCMIILTGSYLIAQNETDAFRYSQAGIAGSARAMGLGGAYSAVGADLASASVNPAGLAVYRKNTFSISPQFSLHRTTSDFLDGRATIGNTQLNIPSWGFTFTGKNYYETGNERREVQEGLKSYTFAIGVNQLENYNRTIDVRGFNTESSISDFFAEQANFTGETRDFISPNSFAGLAARTFVVDTLLGQAAAYYPAVNGGDITQRINLAETGRRNEFFISLAGNFEDVVYFGASMGIQTLRYTQSLFLQETDTEGLHEFLQNNPDFPLESPMNEIRYENEFSTRGTGINVSMGVIVRPVDPLRIGLSVQSPTYFSLTDQFNVDLAQEYAIVLPNGSLGTEELSASIDPGQYRYTLATPFRATFGAMYLLGKSGFLTADVEYTDFSAAILSAEDYDFRSENDNIQVYYRPAVTYRVGGEIRNGIFRLRAGAAIQGDPLSNELKEYLDYEDLVSVRSISNGGKTFITGGIGIRQPKFFLDVTLINERQKDIFTPYTTESIEIYNPTLVNSTSSFRIVTTLGFTF